MFFNFQNRMESADNTTRNQFPAQASYSDIYYVSPSGKDTNDGKTVSTPFYSIDKALSFAEAGDVIELADGEYLQTVSSLKDGNKGSPITIRGSRAAVIRGTEDTNRIIEIRHDYLTLDGFTIDGLSGQGSKAADFKDKLIYSIGSKKDDGVDGLVIKNMLIQNAGGECVRLRYFAVNNEISHSTIRNCGVYDFRFNEGGKNGEGIYIGTAPEQTDDGKNPTAAIDQSHDNHIHHNLIQTYGNECVDIKEGSFNNLVEYNTCEYQMDPESAGLDARGSSNTFRYNTTQNNKGAGIRLGGDTENDGIYNNVYDNSILNNESGAIKIIRMPQGKICSNIVKDSNDPDFKRSQGIRPDSMCVN